MRTILVVAFMLLAGCSAPGPEPAAPSTTQVATDLPEDPPRTTTPPETNGAPNDDGEATPPGSMRPTTGQKGHRLEGKAAPAYEGMDLDGKATALEDHLGRPVMLHVWASWCHTCDREKPSINRLHADYRDQVDFVHVSIDSRSFETAMRDDAAKIEGAHWWDPDDAIRSTFSVSYQPVTIFIHADGEIQAVWQGQRADKTTLRQNEPAAREVLDLLVSEA